MEALVHQTGAEVAVGPRAKEGWPGSASVCFSAQEDLRKWLNTGRVDFLEIYCGFGEFGVRVTGAGQ